MKMLGGKAEAIVDGVDTEDNKGPCMQVGVNYDDLEGDVHFENELEEEAPEDQSDGKLDAEGNFVDDLDVIFETA